MRVTRWGAYAASVSLALTGSLLAAPAQAAYDPAPSARAADWLTGQLDNGLVRNPNFGGFNDYGLTIDFALGLDAVGRDTTVGQIASALSSHVADYTQYPNYPSGTTHTSAGGLAKLGVLADIAGDPTSYGGRDLVAATAARISTTAPVAGRLEDGGVEAGNPDYTNVLGQAYAVRLLSAAGNAKAGSARDFLLQQQCSAGYFRLNLTADKTATDQGCRTGDAPDTDATAIAVLQLAPLSGNATVAAAVAKAKEWLATQQRCDGSFGGGTSTEGANSNSTGLAAWAFGDSIVSRQAARWLLGRQVPQSATGPLATAKGAVAYDDAALAAGREDGVTDGTSDQWRRATAQAAPGLAYVDRAAPAALRLPTPPTGFWREGARPTLEVDGPATGTVVCVSGVGSTVRGIAGSGGFDARLTLPQGQRTRVATVTDGFGQSTTTTYKVLEPRTLTVTRTPGEVGRNATITAAVRGLAPYEPARIYYGSGLAGSGNASASGNFVARFSAGTTLGRQYVRGYGRFGDIRKGYTTVTVVR